MSIRIILKFIVLNYIDNMTLNNQNQDITLTLTGQLQQLPYKGTVTIR